MRKKKEKLLGEVCWGIKKSKEKNKEKKLLGGDSVIYYEDRCIVQLLPRTFQREFLLDV